MNQHIGFPERNDSTVIKCPVLFLHADRDRIVDIEHSRVMHDLRAKSGLLSIMHIQVPRVFVVYFHR